MIQILDDTQLAVAKKMLKDDNIVNSARINVVDVFSSPTNNGFYYCAVINATEHGIEYDPLLWKWWLLGGVQ